MLALRLYSYTATFMLAEGYSVFKGKLWTVGHPPTFAACLGF